MEDYEQANTFTKAKREWKALSQERSWFTVFGDLYAIRYPLKLSDSSGAQSLKRSIFLGDDSVHAWDAKGIRETIVNRVMSAEERGKIRPWYAELGFQCESIVFLRGLEEKEIDFVLRQSLKGSKPLEEDAMEVARKSVQSYLDPDLPKNPDGTLNEFEFIQLQERVIMESSITLEMFGLLSAIGKHLFILSKEDLLEVFKIIFDPEKADKFLRKRFVDRSEDEFKPFVGKFHKLGEKQQNLIIDRFGGGNEEFYQLRVLQLWLYALLSGDKKFNNYLRSKRIDFYYDIKTLELQTENNSLLEKYFEVIYRAVELVKLEAIYSRLTQEIKTDYASVGDYKTYSNKLFHLLKQKKETIEEFSILNMPYNEDRYKDRTILHSLSLVMMESVLKKLEGQIPEPQISSSQKRAIMSRRKLALRNAVLTPKIKEKIIQEVLKIEELAQDVTSSAVFEEIFKVPNEILVPRGEEYFKEMEARVEEIMSQYGEDDIASEVQRKADKPESLVKQFGKEAMRYIRQHDFDIDSLKSSDIYAIILSLKSTEILFDDATTNRMKKQKITESLYRERYKNMVEMLRTFHRSSDQVINEEIESG